MASQRVVLAAPAKINLFLEILGRRPDGFHEIETVFQTLSLADELTITLQGGMDRIELSCSDPSLPQDHRNLAYRAAAAVASRLPGIGGISIELTKRIPHGAGLGGGSSDAAAVLRALARLLPQARALDLPAIALALGSDVPFFLLGGTAHATGRGERLTALPDAESRPLTVLMPGVELPTPAVYGALHASERGPREARGAQGWSDPRIWPQLLSNRLSAAACRVCPEAAAVLARLQSDRIPHLLSGSGAACIAFSKVAPSAGIRAFPCTFRARADLDALGAGVPA